ncbi:unnamed protein product [Clonostachys chloroleuca]|uniref:Uncharacterized protein n=1 Tax=Clonostachys chloroleuca TaxID=1926264 RepID=A0AA35M8Q5_9HYPO|nr:unnamed protein product [Clonostachys chloroleuca]
MSRRLTFVREDSDCRVFTEHPKNIHPQRLSAELSSRFAQEQFRICLLRNVYVIYLDRNANSDYNDTHSQDYGRKALSMDRQRFAAPREKKCLQTPSLDQRLKDLKMASDVLKRQSITV